jgi:hypothetical protein
MTDNVAANEHLNAPRIPPNARDVPTPFWS